MSDTHKKDILEEEIQLCEPCSGIRIEIAKNKKGQFFWLLYAKNGRMVATSPVAFSRLNDLKITVKSLPSLFRDAELVRLY